MVPGRRQACRYALGPALVAVVLASLVGVPRWPALLCRGPCGRHDMSSLSRWRSAGCLVALRSDAALSSARVASEFRGTHRSRTVAAAIVEGDAHSKAMERWIDELVIGHSFCPWAKPAGEAGHIRIVTSTADTENDALADLLDEASRLPRGRATVPDGCATTVVLVCPMISAWTDFDTFKRFFEKTLDDGSALAAKYGLRVVAFHPQYKRHRNVGDSTCADNDEFWKNVALRAPRPALHLLRFGDLDKAHEDMGERMFTDTIFVRNERLAREFGCAWASDLLRRCEGDGVAKAPEPRQEEPWYSFDPLETIPLPESPMAGLSVLWCDSDTAVQDSAGILKAEGLEVLSFQTPEALLSVYNARTAVGVISSMMEGGGRRERGLMNAFELFRACVQSSSALGVRKPVMVVISLSADREAAIAAGADFVVYGNRARAQQLMLGALRNRRAAADASGRADVRSSVRQAQQGPCAG
mmetsp:Transcript_57205/g.159209  ORF Transcript_57205/g.159209 Transcript_57205/m.159209 type:complete len:472 (+) Transcript_57205:58-1473(+)